MQESLRSADLHASALSPAEYDCWMPWVDTLRVPLQSMKHSQLLDACWSTFSFNQAETGTARQPRQDREILGFLRHTETAPTPGETLAILRLIHHARSGGLLCRDHIFLQVPEPSKPIDTPKPYNPFRAGAGSQRPPPKRLEPPQRSPDLRATSNPAASGSLSAPANPFRRGSAPSQSGESSTTGPASPGATTVSSGPPLPPRTKQAPPPPPPQRPAASTSQLQRAHSLNIISSSSERPRKQASITALGEAHATWGSSSGEKKKPPPAAPKPRLGLISSTHISPETNLRPKPMSRSSTDTFDSSAMYIGPSKGTSPGSNSSASINPPVETSVAESSVSRTQRLHVPPAIPPPPPKRRPDLEPRRPLSPDSAPPAGLRGHLRPAHQRANSLSQSGRYGTRKPAVTPTGYNPRSLQQGDTTNPTTEFSTRLGRVIAESEDFRRTSEWVQKAKESIEESVVARAGAPAEREGLLRQQHTADSTSTSASSGLSASGDSLNKPGQHHRELARLRTQTEQGWTQL